MKKLVLIVAFMSLVLTGCGSKVEQNTNGFTRVDNIEENIVVNILGTDSFDIIYKEGTVKSATIGYKIYADTETGYCFIRLISNNNFSSLMPLVNADGSRKENLDSNTNVISLVGISDDKTVVVIEDEDTGVQYVCNGNMNSCFTRY